MVPLNGRIKGDLVGQFTCQTYNGASVVDYIIVSQSLLSSVISFSVADITEFSHHAYLSLVMKIEIPKISADELKLTPHSMSFIWNENQKEFLRELMNSQDVQNNLDLLFSHANTSFESSTDVDTLVNNFSGILCTTSRKALHVRKRKKINNNSNIKAKQTWYDTNCLNLKKNLRNLGNLLTRYPNDSFIRHSFFAKRKEYKRMVRKQKRQFHNSILNQIDMLSENNPQEFWKLVNAIKTRKSNTSNEISSLEWFDYFKTLNEINFNCEKFSTEAQIVKDFNIWANCANDTLDNPITLEELCKLSKRLKNKKASAGDSLSNEIIKVAVESIPSYFLKLFNTILSNGIFPSQWSNGFIVPIHKSGSRNDPSNYRGICISSCLGKFFTLIMNTRLNQFLEEYRIINKCQIGFRKNCRTADHLLVLKTLIDLYKSKRKPIFACFIDFKKAYDSVWREGLFLKLIINGCSRNFIRLLLSMYSSVNSSVKLNEGNTPSFKSYIGVKQGCNLSPTLFNIFINDIPDLFNSSCDPVKLGETNLNCLLYADDLVLLSESKTGLQNCLSKLELFSKKWKLNINFKKSKILLFGTAIQRRRHLSSNWYFDNSTLEQVDEYCYLGIMFHFSGNFKRAQKVLYNKALCVYHSLFKSFSNVENVPIKTLLKLFSSMVVPVLLYSCEVWGPFLLGKINSFEMFQTKIFKITNQIESLHLKFCKRILGVHSKCTNLAVYAELGRAPLITQIATLTTKYWFRITGPTVTDTLVSNAANVCMQFNSQPVLFTKYYLQLCHFQVNSLKDMLIPPDEQDNFCHSLKNTIHECFIQYWKDQIQQGGDNGKLRLFKKLKSNFGLEKYLSLIHNFKHRQAVTKLRISAHRLPVETGRYNNVSYNDRVCKHCDRSEIGDERHFLMSCNNTKFTNLRINFINSLCEINPSFSSFNDQDIFVYIMAMQDKTIMSLVAKYSYNILTIFETHLK